MTVGTQTKSFSRHGLVIRSGSGFLILADIYTDAVASTIEIGEDGQIPSSVHQAQD
jgi:hypothetical protein